MLSLYYILLLFFLLHSLLFFFSSSSTSFSYLFKLQCSILKNCSYCFCFFSVYLFCILSLCFLFTSSFFRLIDALYLCCLNVEAFLDLALVLEDTGKFALD